MTVAAFVFVGLLAIGFAGWASMERVRRRACEVDRDRLQRRLHAASAFIAHHCPERLREYQALADEVLRQELPRA
jgi:hypothetical protein